MRWFKGKAEEGLSRRPGASLGAWRRFRLLIQGWGKTSWPWLSVTMLAAVIIGPTAWLAWLIFFTDMFTVQAITVIDARPHTAEAAQRIATNEVQNMPLGRNIFFVAADLIEMKLVSELPQIRTAHVARKLPGTLKIVIQEKTPALLLTSNGRYYFVDEAGVPYEEARLDTLPEIVLPTVKNSAEDGEVSLGVAAVSEDFVSFVRVIQQDLPNRVNAQVAEIRIPSLAAREVHFLMDNNWIIRMDINRNAGEQMHILSRVIKETIPADELDKVEYIDLRIPNKVYYKTK